MEYQELVSKRLKAPLKQYPFLSVEFDKDSFMTTMANRDPNAVGHYSGGDMAYLATASSAMQCLSEGVITQTTGMSIECIGKGDGDLLLAKAEVVHRGRTLVRLRSDIFTRKEGELKLVAIAQVNVVPFENQKEMQEVFKKHSEG